MELLAYFPPEWLFPNSYTLFKSLQELFEWPFIAVFWGWLETLIFSKFRTCRRCETASCDAYFQPGKEQKVTECKIGTMPKIWESFDIGLRQKCLIQLGLVRRCVITEKLDFSVSSLDHAFRREECMPVRAESQYNCVVSLFSGLHGFFSTSKQSLET